MIWLEKRYAACLDTLLPVELQADYGGKRLVLSTDRQFYFEFFIDVPAIAKWMNYGDRVGSDSASCILERAAREWLEEQGWVEISLWCHPPHPQRRYRVTIDVDGNATPPHGWYAKNPVVWVSYFDDYNRAQLEAMRVLIEEEAR